MSDVQTMPHSLNAESASDTPWAPESPFYHRVRSLAQAFSRRFLDYTEKNGTMDTRPFDGLL